MGEFRMPSLGADMDVGTILEWRVHPGDRVHRGDIAAVVETEKADVEVEVFESGVIEELLVPEGTEVTVGTPLARIGADQPVERVAKESAPTSARARKAASKKQPKPPPTRRPRKPAKSADKKPAAPAATHWQAPPPPEVSSPIVRHLAAELDVELETLEGSGQGGAVTRADVEREAGIRPDARTPTNLRKVSPRARRLAAERNLDLTAVQGSGSGGAITGDDVVRAADRAHSPGAPTPAAPAPTTDKAAAMRAAIARTMARSKREIPHYYLATDIDFSASRTFLDTYNETRPVTERVLPVVLLVKATALAVRQTPELNGFWVDDEFRASAAVHVGVAISLRGGGLVAPAIHEADERDLANLMAALRDLVNRARAGTLRASEMSDPTITVTNLGDQGVQAVYGVIYPPQVALVGFGAISERPWAADGMTGPRPVVTATLAADHRASDGARGARLLTLIDRLLQQPENL